MSKIIVMLGLMIFGLSACDVQAEGKKFKPEKFEVKVTITYNALTLKEAAEKENFLKEAAHGACKVGVVVDKASNDTLTIVSNPGSWASIDTTP